MDAHTNGRAPPVSLRPGYATSAAPPEPTALTLGRPGEPRRREAHAAKLQVRADRG
jgi:hypothetical protein